MLDHPAGERAHIVGHDIGALVAFVLAGAYPRATLSMTCLDEPLVGCNLDQFTTYCEEACGGYWHFGFNTALGLAEQLIGGKEQEFVDYIVPLMPAVGRADSIALRLSNSLRRGINLTCWSAL